MDGYTIPSPLVGEGWVRGILIYRYRDADLIKFSHPNGETVSIYAVWVLSLSKDEINPIVSVLKTCFIEDKPIKILIAIIILLIIHLQYRLWVGDGSVAQINEYQARLDVLKEKTKEKKERNDALYAEVLDLRKGQEAIEERARDELGMIKENETFFQVIEEK